jgi:hypothetical protein
MTAWLLTQLLRFLAACGARRPANANPRRTPHPSPDPWRAPALPDARPLTYLDRRRDGSPWAGRKERRP